MELIRILAKDTRTATERVRETYGEHALIVSNERVGGQTEVIVAIDIGPADAGADEGTHWPARATSRPPARPGSPGAAAFSDALDVARDTLRGSGPPGHRQTGANGFVAHRTPLGTSSHEAVGASSDTDPQRGREHLRAREIVDAVREELAVMRRELLRSQRVGSGQAPDVNGTLNEVLIEAGVPARLRGRLLDALDGRGPCADLREALARLHDATLTAIAAAVPAAAGPMSGVHLLAGPTGSGRTSMAVRLAASEAARLGTRVSVVAWCDQRLGAWNQLQMLGARTGVDTWRVDDEAALGKLLDELRGHGLVLLDAPVDELPAARAALGRLRPDASAHLVLPADASSATVSRWIAADQPRWRSLMLTRLDEGPASWPLLAALADGRVPLARTIDGPSPDQQPQPVNARTLVARTLDALPLELPAQADSPLIAVPSGAARASLVTRLAGMRHAR